MKGPDPIVALGRELTRLNKAWDRLDELGTGTRRPGEPFCNADMERRTALISDRVHAVEKAIVAMPASSADGALVQTALACYVANAMALEGDDQHAEQLGHMVASLLYSVARVLERLSGSTLAELDQARLMPREDDPFALSKRVAA